MKLAASFSRSDETCAARSAAHSSGSLVIAAFLPAHDIEATVRTVDELIARMWK